MSNECTPVSRSNFASRLLNKAINERAKPGKTTGSFNTAAISSELQKTEQQKESVAVTNS